MCIDSETSSRYNSIIPGALLIKKTYTLFDIVWQLDGEKEGHFLARKKGEERESKIAYFFEAPNSLLYFYVHSCNKNQRKKSQPKVEIPKKLPVLLTSQR